jgi:hypothetical protein
VERRLRNDPVQVEIRDASPIGFRWDEREYEVVTLLKMLAFVRPAQDVDTQLWQVRARSGDRPAKTFELECDHGSWRVAALWCAR